MNATLQRTKSPDGIDIFRLSGKLKTSDIPALESMIDTFLAEGARHAVLDFSQLEFLNSQAVGILLRALGTLREQGGNMVVVGIRSDVLEVFRILSLDTLLTYCATEAEALAVIAGNDR